MPRYSRTATRNTRTLNSRRILARRNPANRALRNHVIRQNINRYLYPVQQANLRVAAGAYPTGYERRSMQAFGIRRRLWGRRPYPRGSYISGIRR